jgi:CDP-diacylglycerol--glycerol-3-phosphate 3-phosphatidyltransferase
MPSIYDIKPRFQNLLRPITSWMATRRITANQITILALVLSAMAGAAECFAPQQPRVWLIVPLVLFIRMALNAIDGMLAREHGMKSNLGAILNEVADVLSDAFLYYPLGLVPGIPVHLVASVVILAVISEMTGVVAAGIGASRRYDGPMGKSDRAFVLGLLALLLGLGIVPGLWSTFLLGLCLVLLLITVWNRAARALDEVGS